MALLILEIIVEIHVFHVVKAMVCPSVKLFVGGREDLRKLGEARD